MWDRLAAALVLALVAAALRPAALRAATPAGTALTASASLSYQDARGRSYDAASNTLATLVAAVGALTVDPKQSAPDASTEAFVAGSDLVRTFTVQNASNVSDAYAVTDVEPSAGALASLAFVVAGGAETPVAVNRGLSPPVAPGGSIALRVTVHTAGVAVGTALSLLVRVRTSAPGTANGTQSDYGRAYALAASGPKISGIAGPGAPVDKTVDGRRSAGRSPGASVHFAIAFANTGGAVATNVVVDDPLPAALHLDPASVKSDGPTARVSAAGGHLVVSLPSLAPRGQAVVGFDAVVDRAAPLGSTIANVATVAADGLPPVTTLAATIFVGSAGIVYDGLSAAAAPLGAAVVTLADPASGLAAALAAAGSAPNPANADPFTTAADGAYGFILPSAPGAAYTLLVRAPAGYQNRRIGLAYAPGAGGLATVTATALDGLPLAAEGGYALVNRPVALRDVRDVFPNLPLFPLRAFSIALSADRAFASPGDRIVYTATVQSALAQAVTSAQVSCALPAGLAFAPGTGRLDGAAGEPARDGGTLRWSVPAATAATHTLRFAAVVLPSTPAGQTLRATTTVRAPAGLAALDASATTDVRIVAGALSERGIVTGRVYAARDGHRAGIAGVRIYREDGASVVTDAAGRFSFLGMRPGMHVLHLDPQSLPAGLAPLDDGSGQGGASRLVHGVLDSGSLHDVEFALGPR